VFFEFRAYFEQFFKMKAATPRFTYSFSVILAGVKHLGAAGSHSFEQFPAV